MSVEVELQVADPGPSVPSPQSFEAWIAQVLAGCREDVELCVRIVDADESLALNEGFRGRPGPTNVLAFPAEIPDGLRLPLLGDLVICRRIVEQEAAAQGKSVEAHWAHMVVHGVLHLLGHDHDTDRRAQRMEALEVQILARLGYPDPYGEEDRGGPSARPAMR